MGVACGKIYLDAEEGQEGVAFIIVADFALPTDPAVFVLGNVYRDLNGDHLYNSGEGIEGLTVSVGVFGEEAVNEVKTDPLGNYQVEVTPGFLEIAVRDESGKTLEDNLLLWWENSSLLTDIGVAVDEDVAVAEKKMTTSSFSKVPSFVITW